MHLFTHLRAKCALLLFGAVLWSGTAYADDLATPEGYRELKTYDFTSTKLSSVTLVLSSTKTGKLSNGSGSCDVYPCTTEGYEDFVFQSVVTNNNTKGWAATSSGLCMGGNGNRAAGLTGLKVDQIVDIYYTGSNLYSVQDGTLSAKADIVTAETGVTRFKITTAGTLPFYITQNTYIPKIVVWEVDEGLVSPTIDVEGNKYASQLVTITSTTVGATLYYQIGDKSASSITITDDVKSISFRVFNSATVKAWIEKDDESSEKTEREITAGEVPVPTRSIATNGNDLTIASSLTNAEIYTSTGADSTLYSSSIAFTSKTSLTYWATYSETIDNVEYRYNSEKTTITVAPVSEGLSIINTLDFAKSLWPDIQYDKQGVTLGSDVLFTENGSNFVTATIIANTNSSGTKTDTRSTRQINGLYLVSGASWLKRVGSGSAGLYHVSGSQLVAIPDVKAGQLVEITGCTGQNAFSVSDVINGTIDEARSVSGSSAVIECTADGNLVFKLNKNSYINKINIYGTEAISKTATLNSETSVGTFYWSRTVDIPEDVSAFVGTLDDDNVFTLSQVEGKIPANTPVILSAPGKTSVTLTASSVSTSADIVEVISINNLKGQLQSVTTSSVAGDNNTVWVISNTEENGFGFYKYTGENIVANKAYLVLSSATSNSSDEDQDISEEAPTIRLPFGTNLGNVTAIENVKAEAPAIKGIYDLQGRRVMNATRGLYIMDGKKVLVK